MGEVCSEPAGSVFPAAVAGVGVLALPEGRCQSLPGQQGENIDWSAEIAWFVKKQLG